MAKGFFNVGFLLFRRTGETLACLRHWRDQCLEWCFDRIEPGRFGDQKYLEEWPTRYAGVTILQHAGAGLAPWNVTRYRIRYEQGRVWVNGDPLLFYHFARLRAINRWLYEPCFWWYRGALTPIVRDQVYVPYVRELRAAGDRIRALGGRVVTFAALRAGEHRLGQLARMALGRNFLVVTESFTHWG